MPNISFYGKFVYNEMPAAHRERVHKRWQCSQELAKQVSPQPQSLLGTMEGPTTLMQPRRLRRVAVKWSKSLRIEWDRHRYKWCLPRRGHDYIRDYMHQGFQGGASPHFSKRLPGSRKNTQGSLDPEQGGPPHEYAFHHWHPEKTGRNTHPHKTWHM